MWSEPQLRLSGRRHRTWTTKWNWRVRRRLQRELRLKFQLVDQAARSPRTKEKREDLVKNVLLLLQENRPRTVVFPQKEEGDGK